MDTDDLRPEYARRGYVGRSTGDLVRQAVTEAVVTAELAGDVAALVAHFAGPAADGVGVAAALERVRTKVPGPFEPRWPGTEGAEGAAEFRRRYGGTDELSPAERVADERLTRDRAQVRGLMIAKGVKA